MAKRTLKVEMAAGEAITLAARDVIASGGGFGEYKAFIVEIFGRLAMMNPELTLESFKALCVELNRSGDISLSRADLPEVMDPAKVRRSEIASMGATFHFVRID